MRNHDFLTESEKVGSEVSCVRADGLEIALLTNPGSYGRAQRRAASRRKKISGLYDGAAGRPARAGVHA